MSPGPDGTRLRRAVYALLIVIAAAAVAGRILAVGRVYEPWLFRPADDPSDPRGPWPATRPKPMATLGANDRSRWDTVRALVDNGTYVIGHRDPARATERNKYGDEGIIAEEGWETIDKVLRPDSNDFYSSKPPFLSTLVAGEYWVLKHGLGWSITDPDGTVVRAILLTLNGLPFVAYLVLLAALAERLGATDWGRLLVVAAGALGTFLTPFAITLNNHSVATCCALVALYFTVRLWRRGGDRGSESQVGSGLDAALAGLFAGLTACTELPAAALLAGLLVAACARGLGRGLLCFLPAAAIPVAGFLLTNYLAIGRLTPAYSEVGGPWYTYEGSYWQAITEHRQGGIDAAGAVETKAVYAFHLLIGHHGLFALTPVFLLSVAGLFLWGASADPVRRGLAWLTGLVTAVVVAFYIVKSDNYGGWTSGPRWFMWLTPLLLLTMVPGADRLAGSRWGRGLGYVLLAVSVLSVSYPAWNPWRHPWLYDFLQSRGWIHY